MSRFRNPFTVEEERKIIQYIFRTNGFYRLRGLQFWKELVRDELPTRTYQSLHERFRKYIINNIQNPAYGLSIEEQMKLKRIYEEASRGKKVTTKTVPIPVSHVREATGNLARNFFEISDSDDSNGEEQCPNNSRKSRSSRNPERTKSSNSTNILRNQDTNRTAEIEIESSSDSEVFNLQTDSNIQ